MTFLPAYVASTESLHAIQKAFATLDFSLNTLDHIRVPKKKLSFEKIKQRFLSSKRKFENCGP